MLGKPRQAFDLGASRIRTVEKWCVWTRTSVKSRSWCFLLVGIADAALPLRRTETGLPSLPVLRSKTRSGDDRIRNQRELCNIVGGVISPLLANIFLHYVLDEWFEQEVRPRLKGQAFLIRYADDFVIGVAREDDARRILEVLPKRMSKYGLAVHPEKTRLVRFTPPEDDDSAPRLGHPLNRGPSTFWDSPITGDDLSEAHG